MKIVGDIEKQLEEILKLSSHGDLKILNKWIRTINNCLQKEIRINKSKDDIEKYARILISLLESFIYMIKVDEDDLMVVIGPTVYETLCKSKETLEEYSLFLESQNSGMDFSLTAEQMKSLERLSNFI